MASVNWHIGFNEAQTEGTLEMAKRSIRKNIYGNWVGYVGRNRVEEFGENETVANYWLKTGEVDFVAAYGE